MASRPEKRMTRGDLMSPIPAINIDQGRARAWRQTADNLFRIELRRQDALDTEAALDGWRQGFSGDLNDGLMFAPTIRGEAYTQQAVKSYFQNLEANARIRVDELAAANARDPQGLTSALGEYINGVTANLPQEFAGQARAYLTATGRPYIANARKDLVEAKQAQAEASAIFAERSATLELDRLSADLFSSNAEVAGAAAEGVAAVRARLSAIYSSSVEDDLGNRHPVFSPKSTAKAAIAMEERIARGTLLGWFDKTSNKVGALAAMRDGQVRAPLVDGGKVVGYYNPMEQLSAEDQRSLVNSARAMISAEVGLANQLDARRDRLERRRDQSALADIYRASASDPAAAMALAEPLLASTQDPATVRAVSEIIGQYGIVDPKNSAYYTSAEAIVRNRQWDGRTPFAGVTEEQMRALMALQDQVSRTDSVTSTAAFKRVENLISVTAAGQRIEDLSAAYAAGDRTPVQNQAQRYLADFTREAIMSTVAGKPMDYMSWYMTNVQEPLAARNAAIEEVRAELATATAAYDAAAMNYRRQNPGASVIAADSLRPLREQRSQLQRRLEELRTGRVDE